jgi:hypothetical protein
MFVDAAITQDLQTSSVPTPEQHSLTVGEKRAVRNFKMSHTVF